jgi:hypothetical protein
LCWVAEALECAPSILTFGNVGNVGPPPLVGENPADQLRRGLAVAPPDNTGAKADNVGNE